MSQPGTVYLICFERPFWHTRHYLGWALDLDARIRDHRAGRGSCLMAAVTAAGIGWRVVRTWKGEDRGFESRLKHRRNHHLLCPECGQTGHERRMEGQRRRRAAKRTAA